MIHCIFNSFNCWGMMRKRNSSRSLYRMSHASQIQQNLKCASGSQCAGILSEVVVPPSSCLIELWRKEILKCTSVPKVYLKSLFHRPHVITTPWQLKLSNNEYVATTPKVLMCTRENLWAPGGEPNVTMMAN